MLFSLSAHIRRIRPTVSPCKYYALINHGFAWFPMPIRQNLDKILGSIGNAKLVAVTKGVPLPQIEEAISCGATAIGESRMQEAEQKFPHLSVEKHFIGHLQANKARKAAELCDMVQSIDSERIANKLSKCALDIGRVIPVLIQVNTSGKESQYGIPPRETPTFHKKIAHLAGISAVGLMTIADIEEPRPCFEKMFELHEALGLCWLSMGMTDDYEIAIEEGSNMVRIGRAIFS